MKENAIRIDKWLWYARVFKSRSLAAKFVLMGKVRINRNRVRKASVNLCVGDILTFPIGKDVRVYEVLQLGTRRGPASEARLLYRDLSHPEITDDGSEAC